MRGLLDDYENQSMGKAVTFSPTALNREEHKENHSPSWQKRKIIHSKKKKRKMKVHIVTVEGEGIEKAASCCSCNGKGCQEQRGAEHHPQILWELEVHQTQQLQFQGKFMDHGWCWKATALLPHLLQVMQSVKTLVSTGNCSKPGHSLAKLLRTDFIQSSACKCSMWARW